MEGKEKDGGVKITIEAMEVIDRGKEGLSTAVDFS